MSDKRNGFQHEKSEKKSKTQRALVLFSRRAGARDKISILINKFRTISSDDGPTTELKKFILMLLHRFKQIKKSNVLDVDPSDFITKVLKELINSEETETYDIQE